MSDAIKRLVQVTSQAAQNATQDLQDLAEKQKGNLESKKELRELQNKLESAVDEAGSKFAGSGGVGAVKDGFEVQTQNSLAGMLSVPAFSATSAQNTVTAAMTTTKSAIAEFLKGSTLKTQVGDQKIKDRDTLQDPRLSQMARQLTLASKSAQLDAQNQAIDRGMEEAKAKADLAMKSATAGLTTGIVQGLVTIGSAASSFAGGASTAISELAEHASGVRDAAKNNGTLTPAFESRYQSLASLLDSHSKKLQRKANEQDAAVKAKENQAAKDPESTDSSKDQVDRMRTAIQDLLDKIRSLNPQI